MTKSLLLRSVTPLTADTAGELFATAEVREGVLLGGG